MSTNQRARVGLIAICGASLLALGACSDGGSAGESTTSPAPSASASASGSSSAGTSASVQANVQKDIDEMPTVPDDFVGIADDVDLPTCELKKGAALAEGTVKNTAKTARDLVVIVAWLQQESGGDSYAAKVFTAKNVAAGKSTKIKLEAKLAGDAARCVVQAKSYKAGSIKS